MPKLLFSSFPPDILLLKYLPKHQHRAITKVIMNVCSYKCGMTSILYEQVFTYEFYCISNYEQLFTNLDLLHLTYERLFTIITSKESL